MARTQSFKDLGSFTVWAGGFEMLANNRTLADTVPPAPASFPGSALEWRVYWWLEKHKHQFYFQLDILGGSTTSGGMIVDFLLTDQHPELVLEVQGKPWHFGTSDLRAEDRLRKAILINLGFNVVYLRYSDLAERLQYTMKEALRGHQLFDD